MSEIKNEIFVLQNLSQGTNYGHLMSLLSALWRVELKRMKLPDNGAFVTTLIDFMSEEDKKECKKSNDLYDKLVSENS